MSPQKSPIAALSKAQSAVPNRLRFLKALAAKNVQNERQTFRRRRRGRLPAATCGPAERKHGRRAASGAWLRLRVFIAELLLHRASVRASSEPGSLQTQQEEKPKKKKQGAGRRFPAQKCGRSSNRAGQTELTETNLNRLHQQYGTPCSYY